MKILILDGATFGEDIDISKFNELGEVIVYAESTKQQVLERLKNVNPDAVIVNKIVMGKEEMYTASNLKIILEAATGYNNIDIECAKALNIRVANVAGYSTMSVVQHTFAHLFYLYEKMRYYDDYVKSGDYSNSTIFTNFGNVFNELAGKTWGIVGLGNIGRRVADVAKAFGCKVVYYSASGNTYDTEYEKVELDDLLKNSDIISIHAPLNKYTENLMNYENFKKMKNTAYLINMGRGPIVNEADLAKAINEGEIAGAGLDVLTKEPMSADNPLLTIKDSNKLVITPHNAWATYEARVRLLDEIYNNLKSFINGEARNVVI
jgi:lactate dehydrogenase-like 2-hydroxyacid dehydrogenase